VPSQRSDPAGYFDQEVDAGIPRTHLIPPRLPRSAAVQLVRLEHRPDLQRSAPSCRDPVAVTRVRTVCGV